ncbi:hypothetical protein [Vallitalea guaymasensis]|uniref:Uncharacterized protein n=1 Tax=Vallitalea guaymasensis TaxID=1185412 RepID=A0A8J8MEB4_9FIRM|nr:hypothetical protein [Vallitalea guaymasensis]QUH31110.1 hypothetical protein HYG85_20170 [Vallitalea guaymasensis]
MAREKPLYIPQGLKLRTEIFNGFSKEELIKTIIVTLIAGVIDALLFFFVKNTVVAIVFMLVAVSGTVIMLTKDNSNISVVDQIGFLIKYRFRQKKYRYVYKLERRRYGRQDK